MDKTRTVGQKWLANELHLHFFTLKKYTEVEPILSMLSKVIVLTNYKSTDTQTDTFAKTIFPGSKGLKTWTFDKKGEVKFYTNLIPSLMSVKKILWDIGHFLGRVFLFEYAE